MIIQIFDGSDEPCHEAQADSLDECKAMLYKPLAIRYQHQAIIQGEYHEHHY
jgi:hypothetical protein